MENQTSNVEFIGFSTTSEPLVKSIKEDLEKIGHEVIKLNNVIFIDLTAEEFNGQSQYLQHFAGIDIVNQILRENHEKKIILVNCLLPLSLIRKQRPEIDLLLQKNNIRLYNVGDEVKELLTIFDDEKSLKIENGTLHKLATMETSNIINVILHDFQKAKDIYNPTSENERSMVTHGINKAKNYFPSLQFKTDKEILDFILSVKQEIKEVMLGQSIDGVYCDIEGTLLVDGLPNIKVTKMLAIYERKGKKITLWTGGNLAEIQELLDKAGISYTLESKYNFAGAIAEIVIDNDDENTFFAKTKIYPKTFIMV